MKTTEHRFAQKKMNLGYAIQDKINWQIVERFIQ